MSAFSKNLDSRLPAISRPWRLHLNFSCQLESNGWFSAIELIARISGPGHNRSFACSRKLPPERPFNSGTRQTANSYNSANADAQECQEQWQLYTKLQTSTHQRDSIETAVAVNTHQKSMFSATPADAFLTSERLGCRFAFPQPQSTQDCSGRAGCGKNALG